MLDDLLDLFGHRRRPGGPRGALAGLGHGGVTGADDDRDDHAGRRHPRPHHGREDADTDDPPGGRSRTANRRARREWADA